MNNVLTSDLPTIIRPEILAYKFAAVANLGAPKVREQFLREPRLIELLWFIQAMSMEPGGLMKFVEDLTVNFSNRFKTKAMAGLNEDADSWTLEQRVKLLNEFPSQHKRQLVGSDAWKLENNFLYASVEENAVADKKFSEVLRNLDVREFCRQCAIRDLPNYLVGVCNERETPFEDQWYLPNLTGTLLDAMDLWHKESSKALAMTAVAVKVFDALDYAWEENALVRIEGDTRFGKTESVRTWCKMNLGKARLVQTPCTNLDSDLYRAIAEAIGIEFSYNTPTRQIKEKVEFVIRFGVLMLIFDEAHFLLPTRFSVNTPPMRLNWVRTQIVDRKCPVALVTTPQTYRHCMNKFVKVTGHNIDQFLGRTMLQTILPNELDFSDLVAVAKIHLPDLDQDCLELIASKAEQSESYLFAVESIAKRARYISKNAHHSTITLDDLERAIADTLPDVGLPQPINSNLDKKETNNTRRRGIKKPIETSLQEPFKDYERGNAISQNRVLANISPALDSSRRTIHAMDSESV